MLVDKKGNIMNILKGIGIICGATAILVMGIWSVSYVILESDGYKARHGDREALDFIEKHNAFVDQLAEANSIKEVTKITKERFKNI